MAETKASSLSRTETAETMHNLQPHPHHLTHAGLHPLLHLDEGDDDGIAGADDGAGGVEDPADNNPQHAPHSHSQIPYDNNPLPSHHLHNGVTTSSSTPAPTPMETAEMNGIEVVGQQPPFYAHSSDIVPSSAGRDGADQLTLSFQGEVYVFDSVSPEKVQAVLLLLGGYEVPTGIPTVGVPPDNLKSMGGFPGRSSKPQRAASLNRFREKRKGLCFDKKIRYNVRKEVALRMQRKKGQFTSSKSVSEEVGSSFSEQNNANEQETSCRHCGISSKSTPMMRRGPDGPRTLCNACGLKWANKGILRDLAKIPAHGIQNAIGSAKMESNGELNVSDAVTAAAAADIMAVNGDKRDLNLLNGEKKAEHANSM